MLGIWLKTGFRLILLGKICLKLKIFSFFFNILSFIKIF